MGREIRRVPHGWEHPRDARGEYVPLYDETYEDAAEEYLKKLLSWEAGDDPDRTQAWEKYHDRYYWDWEGMPPDRESYRSAFTSEPTSYQIYESVSEGTPVSPVFDSEDELIAWLMEQGHTERAAREFVEWGSAPSFFMSPEYGLEDGITALEHMSNKNAATE